MDIKKMAEKTKVAMFLIIFTVLFIYLVFSFKEWIQYILSFFGLLKSVFIGIGIAYVLNLPMKRIEHLIVTHTKENNPLHRFARSLSLLLTYLLALVLVAMFFIVLIPKITESIMMLINNLGLFIRNIVEYVDHLLERSGMDYQITQLESIQSLLTTNWQTVIKNVSSWAGSYFPTVVNSGSKVVGTFGTWMSSLMISMYLLGDKERYIRQMKKLITAVLGYHGAIIVEHIGKKANEIFSTFIGKTLVEAGILGAMYYTGLILFKFPFPELNTLILMVLSLIPIFGSMLAMCIGALLLLAIDPSRVITYIIYFQVVTNFETYVIYPQVVGDSIGVSGFYVLLALILFGAWFGMVGMLLAVPIMALLYSVISELVNDRLDRKRIRVSETDITYRE